MSEANNTFPFDIVELDPTLHSQVKNYFNIKSYNAATVRFGPKGYLYPKMFDTIGREIYSLEVRPSDVFVVTFPKSGTTWTQELVWLINNNFDYKKAIEIPLNTRFPFIEPEMLRTFDVTETNEDKASIMARKASITTTGQIKMMSSPRFLKSHLPFSLLPPKLLDTCKVVYVAREPKDVAVSFYHHSKLARMCSEDRDFKSYWSYFKNNLVPWSPYFEHVKEAWQLRHHPNMLFLFYEELSKDLAGCVRRVGKHFNKEVSDEQMSKLCEHLNIDNFKKNRSVNLQNMKDLGIFNENGSFIRQGKVGGWRSYFDEEMTKEAERWIEENLQDTDLCFPQ